MVLPRFMGQEADQVIVPEATMREAVAAMFESVGMAPDAAAECAQNAELFLRRFARIFDGSCSFSFSLWRDFFL